MRLLATIFLGFRMYEFGFFDRVLAVANSF
jgi:hypothetical protein